MEHDLAYASIIYLASFRLAIIAVGGLSIVLGYQLFAKGLFPDQEHNTTLKATLGENSFTLKNAAPGTFFALFGVILIAMMLVNAPAEVDFKKNNHAETQSQMRSTETVRLRGVEDNTALAKALNGVAWNEYDAQSFQKAVVFSRLSLYLTPENPNLMDTLATMLLQVDQYAEALKYKEKAAIIEPKYSKGIQRFRDAAR